MKVPNLPKLGQLAWEAWDHAPEPVRVTPSAPILFFGDLEAYWASPLRVVTVGLNPSGEEFPKDEPFKRFPLLKGNHQDRDAARYLQAMSAYFETEPYRRWFNAFEPLLNGLGSSYYKGSNISSRALHTDICSPVATDPTWGKLDKSDRKSLQSHGIPLWHRLLEKLQPHIVVLSVARKYRKQIQFKSLTDWQNWETVYTFTKKANGTPRSRSYPIERQWDGKRPMFAFGQAAQTPFGLLAKHQKREAGERLKKRYLEEVDMH